MCPLLGSISYRDDDFGEVDWRNKRREEEVLWIQTHTLTIRELQIEVSSKNWFVSPHFFVLILL